MISVPKYNKNNRAQSFEMLPKGAYVCKIMDLEETTSKAGKRMVKISFDIAEGEHKDFYAKQYKANTSEDKKWSYDAVIYLSIPEDGSETWVSKKWDTFWADVEDSNNGYVFDGDEAKAKGKLFGAVFRNEQTENNGTIYDHTRFAWSKVADDVRNGNVGRMPSDKLVEVYNSAPADSSGFMTIVDGEEDLPFGKKSSK